MKHRRDKREQEKYHKREKKMKKNKLKQRYTIKPCLSGSEFSYPL